ncbi:MAG: hydrolase 2, exosortase A system-associated [Steroidobacteraceae bacterium]
MTGVRSETFYVQVGGGHRLCILHRPDDSGAVRGGLVHVHAFGEEMNKSRRMTALGARALAANGWAVLLIDLDGCGDSSGGFADASWERWIDDVLFAHGWIADRYGKGCWLWGLRAGCLIAAAAAERLDGDVPLLFWQPVTSGHTYFTQLLRLKLANATLSRTDERTGTRALRAQLATGSLLELGGYALTPPLTAGLERAELRLESQRARVVWFEISNESHPQLGPASHARLARVRERGVRVDSGAVSGPTFWQTLDISEAPALIAASVASLAHSDDSAH